MRLIHGSVLGTLESNGRLAGLVRHNLRMLTGLALMAVAAALSTSLATWSVNDPSFSHATNSPVRNALGFPGSVMADLSIQMLGIASVFFVLTILYWGWRLLKYESTVISYKHILTWLTGTLTISATVTAIPAPETWPLPTGLGGIIGSSLLSVSHFFTVDLTSGKRAVSELLVFGIPSIIMFAYTFGLIGNKFKQVKTDKVPVESALMESEPVLDEFEDEYEDGVSALTGAFMHWIYMVKFYLYRLIVPKFIRNYIERKKRKTLNSSRIGRFFRKFKLFRHNDGLDELYALVESNSLNTELNHSEEPIVEGDLFNYCNEPEGGQSSLLGGLDTHSRLKPVGYSTVTESDEDSTDSTKSRIVPQAKAPKQSKRLLKEAQQSFFPSTEEFNLPTLHMLTQSDSNSKGNSVSSEELNQNARTLEGVLEDFGIRGEISEVRPGPVVTLYELLPAPGIKTSRVIGLADDIARSMSAISARVAVIPGKNAIGIELPNQGRETVYLRELIGSTDFEKSKAKLAIALGKKINGESVIVDLARMPHLLVAGTTGSGKSVSVNTMILSLLYRLNPDQCKLIMIDPKMLELSIYEGIPHLLTPVVTDPGKAVTALKWTVREMEERYKMMSKVGVRNIDGFNSRIEQAQKQGKPITRTVQTGFDSESGEAIYEEEQLDLSPLPFIVVIVDEMADLMMVAGKDIEGAIQRLAQMARAAGIHLIMATQRPSVDVITGTIKANFPTRISFQVTSKIDSRTILGEQGAEQLLGMGDMLYMAGGGRIQRVHAPFVTDNEVDAIVEHLKSQGSPQYLEQVTEEAEENSASATGDDNGEGSLYDQAVAIVLRDRKASTSYIQRRLSIGYNRAATLIEQMESNGIISQANHAGKREVLVQDENEGF